MAAEKGSSKADTLVKVVLVFFISLLSFSVGTFVGKQVSDSDHRRMALEGEYKADRSVASTGGSDTVEASDKITEKEVESLTEEFVNKEKSAGGDEVAEEAKGEHAEKASEKGSVEKAEATGYKSYNRATAKVADAKGETKPETAAPEKAKPAEKAKPGKAKTAPPTTKAADATGAAAEKVAEGKAPSDGKAEDRKPSSALPSVASSAVGKYTVQVASYADEKEAKTHAADLKGKGWNSFYFAATVSGRTWYRVSVGLFNNQKSANEFRAQFMKDANTKAALVQKIIQ
jgi:septal ring-binding cell division protein DamX